MFLLSTPSPARLSIRLTVDVNPRGQKFTRLPSRALALRTEVRQHGGLSLAHPYEHGYTPTDLQCAL